MARIPESEIERLKSEVSVQRLAEASGLELKKSGKDFTGRCPFHADDTASPVTAPGKNLWHCFGCGAAGGPLDWVMKTQGVRYCGDFHVPYSARLRASGGFFAK